MPFTEAELERLGAGLSTATDWQTGRRKDKLAKRAAKKRRLQTEFFLDGHHRHGKILPPTDDPDQGPDEHE